MDNPSSLFHLSLLLPSKFRWMQRLANFMMRSSASLPRESTNSSCEEQTLLM